MEVAPQTMGVEGAAVEAMGVAARPMEVRSAAVEAWGAAPKATRLEVEGATRGSACLFSAHNANQENSHGTANQANSHSEVTKRIPTANQANSDGGEPSKFPRRTKQIPTPTVVLNEHVADVTHGVLEAGDNGLCDERHGLTLLDAHQPDLRDGA